MKYIEFYDENSIENLCACLMMLPEEVIMVGDNAASMKRHIENCKKMFSARGQNVEFSYKTVSRWKTDQVLQVLEEILQDTKDCVFGITGGDEMAMFALGILCERHKAKNIQVHRISVQNNTVYDCDMDGTKIEKGSPKLSVAENVRIYGGTVIFRDETAAKGWDVNPEFIKDVEAMWSICKKNPRGWNSHAGLFDYLGKEGLASEDLLSVEVKEEELRNYCNKQKGDIAYLKELLEALCDIEVITIAEKKSGTIVLKYKNNQIRKCLSKAGQVLEMKIYLTARELVDSAGNKLYNDAMTGVEIDWDGEIHSSKEIYDTINEIDVFLMHNMVPIFISCKNGDVTSDELYKIQTVAERFGGKYAKKVLVVSALPGSKGGKLLKQRADDMNIRVITGNDLMNDKILKEKLKNLWR